MGQQFEVVRTQGCRAVTKLGKGHNRVWRIGAGVSDQPFKVDPMVTNKYALIWAETD